MLNVKQLKTYIMKMSQYNWNWWFILSLLTILIGLMIASVSKSSDDMFIAEIICIGGVASMIPCLYIGCKPITD